MGKFDSAKDPDCKSCRGKGYQKEPALHPEIFGSGTTNVACAPCLGTGKLNWSRYACSVCGAIYAKGPHEEDCRFGGSANE